jgi:glycosyltransferase involved in cell wall biosynthesis
MGKFHAAVVCSQDDRVEAMREAAGNGTSGGVAGASTIPVEIVVNGADTTYFTPQRQPDTHPTVLMLGTMHYYPNIDAVQYYFGAMHDALRAAVPNLRVLIVGHNPPPEIEALGTLPGVTVTGSVPDIRPYMGRAWLQMVPLRLGGGTRLKIVESMAAGLPVVSTAVGAQGLAVRDGAEMLLADEPADFVRKVAALLNNPQERERMSANARLFVEANYSWQSLGDRFARFCLDTVEMHRSQQALRGTLPTALPQSPAVAA